MIHHENKGFFQVEIIINMINVLVSWVYSRYKYFTFSVRGLTLDVRRQILTSKVGPRAEKIKTC